MSASLPERFAREYQAYHRISPERCRQQLRLLEAFEATLEGDLSTADRDQLQAFAGDLLAGGLHVNTVRKKLNMIRPFYSWAYAAGVIDADRYMRLKSVQDPRGASSQSEPKPYSKAELEEFWEALELSLPFLPERGRGSLAIRRWLQGKGRWRRVWKHAMRLQVEAIIALALDCGLRRGEIFKLSLNDLHYDNEYIVVTTEQRKGDGTPVSRQVPFTNYAHEKVKDWLEFRSLIRPGHERPWLSCYGQHTYTRPMSEDRFNELLSKLFGKGWELHRFRHTCATNWLKAGQPLEDVSKLLGHSSLQQTLAYAKIVEKDIAGRMAKNEARFDALRGRKVAA